MINLSANRRENKALTSEQACKLAELKTLEREEGLLKLQIEVLDSSAPDEYKQRALEELDALKLSGETK